MGDPKGFQKHGRAEMKKRPVKERIRDWREFESPPPAEELRAQASRCMDCGVPFCHAGCPLGNLIPDWNDLVYRGREREAWEILLRANDFPEITGRVCPAPCEGGCVLGLIDPAVTIKAIERHLADRAETEKWLEADPPAFRTGRRVAVVGSGPAGLAAAVELNRCGHTVTVFERADRAGGLLRYGIPDFKLDKKLLDRRIELMRVEGISLETGVEAGRDLAVETLLRDYQAVLLAGGATRPRDLVIPGRELGGIHFAMDFLTQSNRRRAGLPVSGEPITAEKKRVVVLGGGDTGADCVGTAIRQGAQRVVQVELLPEPAATRPDWNPWPEWPLIKRTASSHEEGCERLWSVSTLAFAGTKRVEQLRCEKLRWAREASGRWQSSPVASSAFTLEADLVLLALGFLGPETGLIEALGVERDARGNVATPAGGYATSRPGVFAAGDMRRGQSLVVWALAEGRAAAREMSRFLAQ